MKKNIGRGLALYPAPIAVIGAMVNGRPNWVLAGHLGIMGHDHVMVSLAQPHYTNQGIRASKKLSIHIVDEALLPRADRVGCIRVMSDAGVPMIANSPVVMECQVEDIYETKGVDNFICTITNTYAEESILTADGKIDYRALKPVLFEMPTYEYLKTGEILGKCKSFGKTAQE